MELDISTRHGAVSAKTRARIEEKVSKLSRYHERITSVHVTVDVANPEESDVELRASVERASELVARAKAATVSAALDGALHKMEQQLRKLKQKRTEHRAPGIKNLEAAAEEEPASDASEVDGQL